MTLENWKKTAENCDIAVIGIGVSNMPLIRFLAKCGAVITAHDKRTAEQLGNEICTELYRLNVKLVSGEDYLKQISPSAKYIFKTPGIRYDIPELLKAKSNGAVITSEMELFFELSPAKKIAVTGSDGKTTTTSLIYEMLKKSGYNCYLGGNIGRPLIEDVEKMTADDIAVLELSSFQLHTIQQSADVAVVTNVTPNHLDWHTDFDEYKDSKKAVFKYQGDNGKVVLNYDNFITKAFADEAKNPVFFSLKEILDNGYCLNKDKIVFMQNGKQIREILDINDIYIPGMHNVENYMAAIAATDAFINDDTVRCIAKEFKGVPHRIEFVRELNGIKFYNDSIASSPARTTAGLVSFGGKKLILIAGGYDKKIPFDDFGAIVNDYVKELVLVGATSNKIERAVLNADNYNGLKINRCDNFEEAVKKAYTAASGGDIVILSPACASFDLFKNFEVRGNTFKEIVNNLE